jgi:hypothetical protein
MIDDTAIALMLGLAIGLFVGWKAADTFHKAMIGDILHRAGVTPEKLQDMMTEMQKEIGIEEEFPKLEIKIEQHSGQLYAFRKDNNLFLAQGADRETLLKTIAEKLTNVTLVIAEADGAAHIKSNPTS